MLSDRAKPGLPTRTPGRPTAAAEATYRQALAGFAALIEKLRSRLDFNPSSRGWCYVLENQGIITKGEFDAAQRVINACRKDGTLPLSICSEDGRRVADGVEDLDGSIDEEIDAWVRVLASAHEHYTPLSFWEGRPYYLQMAVEKVDLKHLFAPICDEFHVPIVNIGGWGDLNCRAALMERFAEHEEAGQRPVLLYCGDFDPGGLHISDFLRQNLEELSGAVGWHPNNLIIDRYGLNHDDIERLGLLWIDNLETGSGKRLDDPKHPDNRKAYVRDYIARFGVRKVEANALIVRPAEGRDLCHRAILKYLPESSPQDYVEQLEPHRLALRRALVERFELAE